MVRNPASVRRLLSRALVPLFAAALSLVTGGCAEELESKAVTLDTLTPDLVCNQQLITPVVIAGSGFSPLPTNVLAEPTALVLPSVKLTQTQDLTGAPASSPSVTISGEPDGAFQEQLTWQSQAQMTLTVIEELALVPGLHDVTVTQPDGTHSVTRAQGLAVVPPPVITSVEPVPPVLCTDQEDRTFTIRGENFLQVGDQLPTAAFTVTGTTTTEALVASAADDCTAIPGTYAGGTVQLCNVLTFILPMGRLTPGDYEVTVTNPAPAACVTTDPARLVILPPPTANDVAPVPPAVCTSQEDRTLTIDGENFVTVAGTLPDVTFTPAGGGTAQTFAAATATGCTAIPGTLPGGPVEQCTTLTVTLPMGALPAGAYDVTITNPDPVGCVSEAPLRVVIVLPPLVSALVPPAICLDQTAQTVVAQGGNFLVINGDEPDVRIESGGTTLDLDPTSLGNCVPLPGLDPGDGVEICDEITITVPNGALPPGAYTITITNPDPAGCSSTEAITLAVNPPPTVTTVAPLTVCTGGSDMTITGTDFQPGAIVRLACPNGNFDSSNASVNTAGTQIDAVFGSGPLAGDTCDVVVLNPDGCEDRPLPHRTVTITDGPIAFYVDPPIVFNGLNTRVTVYVTSVAAPVNSVVIRPTGSTTGDITLSDPQIFRGNRVQATVPAGTAAGTYDLVVDDAAPCSATFVGALVITDATTLDLLSIDPPFGHTGSSTGVQILRDTAGAVTFSPTPRAFLNPTGTPDAVALESLTQLDQDTLTAVVPAGTPAGSYDLVVINPTGEVGVLVGAYQSLADLPPVVADVTPQSIVSATGQTVTVSGSGFRTSAVSLDCRDLNGAVTPVPTVTSAAESCTTPESCTQAITIDGSVLGAGTVCVVRVTNADGSYGDYSALAVTGTSFNLQSPGPGSTMNQARRALVSAAAKTTSTSRYVYAIGGDGGAAVAGAPFASVEYAPVTVFGQMLTWQNATAALRQARSFAASATLGRYVYVIGGSDGAAGLATAERALILSPEESPKVSDVALALCPTPTPTADCPAADSGLEPGQWSYRVAAVFDASDPHNPGGESLPSDPFVLKLPDINGRQISVRLSWTPPVDNQGAPLTGVAGYRIYRTPVVDGVAGVDEVLIGTTTGTATDFLDDGNTTVGSERPLPPGSTGRWAALPDLSVARVGAGGAVAQDPATPGTWYVYAMMGKDSPAATGGTGHTSYEYLTITMAANGYQTVASAWTAGAQQAAVGRWQFGTWVVDRRVSTFITSSDTWVYAGGGRLADGTLDGRVEAGRVLPGGDLGAFADDPTAADAAKDFSSTRAGYGVAAAADRLFTFGGANGAPSNGANAAPIVGVPDLANNSWNNEGLGMTQPRYLMGSSIQSAFIFLIGGDVGGGVATNTTEAVVW